MKALAKYSLLVIVMILPLRKVMAQQVDNYYKATNASMMLIQGDRKFGYLVKDVAIVLTESNNQLNVRLSVPDSVLNHPLIGSQLAGFPVLMNVTLNVDPVQIQDNLTSSRVFTVRGNLLINKINKTVEVNYMPMVSGTEELGNFNLFVTVQFDPADFNITTLVGTTRCILQVNNAPVNRL